MLEAVVQDDYVSSVLGAGELGAEHAIRLGQADHARAAPLHQAVARRWVRPPRRDSRGPRSPVCAPDPLQATDQVQYEGCLAGAAGGEVADADDRHGRGDSTAAVVAPIAPGDAEAIERFEQAQPGAQRRLPMRPPAPEMIRW